MVTDILKAGGQMNALALSAEHSYSVIPEIPLDVPADEIIRQAYATLDLDDMFCRYAFEHHRNIEDPRQVSDEDVLGALHTYNGVLSLVSMQTQEPDIAVLKHGFGLVYDGMDAAIDAKRQPPLNAIQRLLLSAGVGRREAPQHLKRLDERFWTVQFPEMLAGRARTPRQSEDTDAVYLWRVLDECIKGFAFSRFSYVQQAG